MFNKKINKIRHAVSNDSFPTIHPAKSVVPDWYKDQPKFSDGVKDIKRLPTNLSFKMCSSFGDAFLSGYSVPLPVDIAVEEVDGNPIISWASMATQKGFLEIRDKSFSEKLPTPEGYYDQHIVWNTQFYIEIPKGYSVLVTHPFNRYDLPFITLTGIIDGKYSVPPGSVPVFFRKGFEGVIPAGTPIMQILPFKTENWESIHDQSIREEANINDLKSTNAAYGWYKKNIWKKKFYN
jgi:hypothetical protein